MLRDINSHSLAHAPSRLKDNLLELQFQRQYIGTLGASSRENC